MNDQQVRRKRVLVCGCDEQLAMRVADVLPDCSVERLLDRDAILKTIASEKIDLLLTGRESTGRQDIELLRQIHALSPRPQTRVIIMTVESSRQDVIDAIRESAFSYFSKPAFDAAFDEILRHAAADAEWEDAIQIDVANPAWLRLTARCELATADRVIQFLNAISELNDRDSEAMSFALKEIVMNAIEYGGNFDRERRVEVACVRAERMVMYRVRDPGEGFSLQKLTHSAISNPPEEPVRHLEIRNSMGIRPGGFGVLLSQKLVDELIYNQHGNDVLLIKYIEPAT